MEIVWKQVDEVIPYWNNPRRNEQAVVAVAASIREFGFQNPIIVDSDFTIIAGHTRLEAAKQLQLYAKKRPELTEFIRDHSELIMIDFGAHSFQKGTQVDFDAYTNRYAEFIQRFDQPHVLGYFEMDVDNVIGYERVLQLRSRLEAVSDKIIPAWHKGRGISEFKRMCEDYAGRIVAVTGFKNEDIQDHQYMMFLKYAWDHGCKVHCLGMTRKKILDNVPFDYVDSSSWLQQSLYGKIAGEKTKVSQTTSRARREVVFTQNYLAGIRIQKYYEQRWRHYEK